MSPDGGEDGEGDALRSSGREYFLAFYNKKVKDGLQADAGGIEYAPIPGNLYTYRALAAFGDTSGLFQSKASPLLMVGLTIVIIVQVTGPICILFFALYRIQFGHEGNLIGTYAITNYK